MENSVHHKQTKKQLEKLEQSQAVMQNDIGGLAHGQDKILLALGRIEKSGTMPPPQQHDPRQEHRSPRHQSPSSFSSPRPSTRHMPSPPSILEKRERSCDSRSGYIHDHGINRGKSARGSVERETVPPSTSARTSPVPSTGRSGTGSEVEDPEAEEMMELARHEAEAARRLGENASRLGPVPATPDMAFGHLPVPLRNPAAKVSDWMVDRSIHDKFKKFTACENNRNMEIVEALKAKEQHVSFAKYADLLIKCKNFVQWKARANKNQVPIEAVCACRTHTEVLRLMVLKFMHMAPLGEAISALPADRGTFVDEEAADYMSQ